jgi:hypothetical protein
MPDRQKIIEAIRGLRYGDPVHFGEWAVDLADAIIAAPVASATVIKPGDSVLVVLDGVRTMAELEEFKELLGPRFPGVSITIATGVSEVVVKPADGGSASTEFIGAAE